jgi:L-iditol 2-dehydrogenase
LLHKIPESMDYVTASLIEPFTVAYNGIRGIGGCDHGDTVVIQGGGTIGLCAVHAACAMGARVIVSEPQPFRREMAKKSGAYIAVDPLNEDLPEIVRELTGGYGADLVVEASGNANSMKQSLDLVRNNGRVSYIGANVGTELPVEIGKIQMKGLRVQGFLGSPKIWLRAIDFLERAHIDLSVLSTHKYALADADTAFEFARDVRGNDFIKVTLLP